MLLTVVQPDITAKLPSVWAGHLYRWPAQAFVLQVPRGVLSQGAAPEANTPFVKQLSARLSAAYHDDDAASVQSSSRCTMNSANSMARVSDMSLMLRCVIDAPDHPCCTAWAPAGMWWTRSLGLS